MPLHLIQGPLNSGRTGILRRRVIAAANAEPLVVAPTSPARQALEHELCEEAGGAYVGPSVTSPDGLAEAVLDRAGVPLPRPAGQAQRLALIRRTLQQRRPQLLARSADRRGFATALLRLFEELRSDRVDPADPTVAEDRYLAELLDLYAGYLELLEAAELTDRAGLLTLARRSLVADPGSWGARPVFLYNFDDLNSTQLALIIQLAETAPVTISITHEDRRSLAARARLYSELAPLLDGTPDLTEPDAAYTASPLLFHLERHFGEDETPQMAADDSLILLRSAGRRSECELITERLKMLLADGVQPGDIAIATRDPAGFGRQLAGHLGEAGVPVALHANLKLSETATGATLLDLLAIAQGDPEPGTLLRYLRRAGSGADQAAVDRLERSIRVRQVTELDQALAQAPIPLRDLRRLIGARDDAFVEVFDLLLSEIGDRTAAACLDPDEARIEALAARVAGAAVRDLRRLGDGACTPEALTAVLPLLGVPAGQVRLGQRVRIASPYELYTVRSGRVAHLFVAGLQDGEFPRTSDEGPFLSNDQRAALGMRERADTDAEEMYLFQICLALPTQGLWLSTRVATEDGKDAHPSPFLELIEDLLERDETGSTWPPACLIERDIATVTHPPEQAPSRRQLLRALALERNAPPLEPDIAGELRNEIDRASHAGRLASTPRPLSHPRVLAELKARTEFGASELESYSADPGAWFVRHGLEPRRFGPAPEPLRLGGLSHSVLEQLFRERPGDLSKPYPETLAFWQERMAALVRELAAAHNLSPDRNAADRIAILRVERFLALFIAKQAEGSRARVEPRHFEAGFGSRDGSDKPPLPLGDWSLVGKIDRVDLTPEGAAALIHDYKFSAAVSAAADFAKTGLLQLPLYVHAVRRLWQVEVHGALYHPLRSPEKRPRGMVGKDDDAVEDLDGIELVRTDRLAPEDFERLIAEALERAEHAVAGIRQGGNDGPPLPGARTPEPAVAAIHRRFSDRFTEPDGREGGPDDGRDDDE